MEKKQPNYNEDFHLDKPNRDGNVRANQICPGFCSRENTLIKECQYCRYADFNLDKAKPLDVSICCFPTKIVK